MHPPLQTIHDFVYHGLQPAQLVALKEAAVFTLCASVQDAISRIRSEILLHICSVNNKKGKRTLVQSYQVVIIDMINQLHSYSKLTESLPIAKPVQEQQAAVYRNLRDQLLQNLDVLDYFPDCVHKHLPLPDHLYETHKELVRIELCTFEDNWKNRIEDDLLHLVKQPASEFIHNKERINPSYETCKYLVQIFATIGSLAQACPTDANTALVHLLIHENFNHPCFISYAIQKLQPHYSEEGITGDLLALMRWRHQLKKPGSDRKRELYANQPSCRQAISGYIEQEIQMIEQEKALQCQPARGAIAGAEVRQGQLDTKTCLTISQLGHLLKALNDSGLLKCKPLQEMFKQVAGTIATARAKAYSPGSLDTAYYANDPAVKRIVKDYVIKLLNELKR